MALNCVFCNIINRTEKADILYEDKDIIIFKDIRPVAETHVLIVPKNHIENAKSLKLSDKELVEKLISAGNKLLIEKGIELNNNNILSGFHWPPFNTVNHLHLHYIYPTTEMKFLSRLAFKPGTLWFVTPDYVLNRLSKEDKKCSL